MIEKLEVTAIHFGLDEKLKRYVEKKIGRLDRFVPPRDREPLHAEVFLVEEEGNAKNRFVCEVTLHLPHETLAAKEATINMYAAVDIAEAKLKHQLQRYKGKETAHRLHQRLLRRVKRFGRH